MTSGETGLGANVLTGTKKTRFRVWAPRAREVALVHVDGGGNVLEVLPMEGARGGFFGLEAELPPGTRYLYQLDSPERRRPDPRSRYQPEGVHGPSEVVDPGLFHWSDSSWDGIPQEDLVIYEMHVGTYSREGTFGSVIPYLPYLKDELGVTCIELMPVAQFAGDRNWGYDGTHIFAPQASYGGPEGLKSLVDSCHRSGLAVLLDVVYNHLGPEGNYLAEFGPYFSDRYSTPWGQAVNYDSAGSDEVRSWVTGNASHWISEYHMDGLRLDAVQRIFDSSPTHILQDIADSARLEGRRAERRVHVIAESDQNDPRLVLPPGSCGYGLGAVWADDFHNSIHAFMTGERFGYYEDFGAFEYVARALGSPFVYHGQYSEFRGRSQGAPANGLPGRSFVVCLQNHDQVGNRPDGARLGALVDGTSLRLAAGVLLLSPYVPLVFMGEEFGASTPFHYFVSHGDPELSRAVSVGRRKEFEAFRARGEFADPSDPATFESSKVDHASSLDPVHRETFLYYRELLRLRRAHPSLGTHLPGCIRVVSSGEAVAVHRWVPGKEQSLLLCNFGGSPRSFGLVADGAWVFRFGSEAGRHPGDPGKAPPTAGEALGPRSLRVFTSSLEAARS